MSKILFIQLNMARLLANMSREDNRQLTEDEVCQWLKGAGFTASGAGWLVTEENLGQLDPSEVHSVVDAPGDETTPEAT